MVLIMTKEEKYFIYLIKCYLYEEKPEIDEEIDFIELAKISAIHNVTGIIAVELRQLPLEKQPKGYSKSVFLQSLGLTVQEYEKIVEGDNLLQETFSSNNIDYMIVKGSSIRELFPSPELRTSGDTDVIVKKSQFDKAGEVLLNSGFIKDHESGIEHDYLFNNHLYEIKDHFDSINEYTDILFENPFDDKTSIKNGNIYQLKPEYNLVHIIFHMLKHIKYKGAGIRQLMDIDICIQKTNVNLNKVMDILRELHLEKSSYALLQICKECFGTNININIEIEPELKDKLLDIIIKGGVFGFDNFDVGGNRLNLAIGTKPDRKFLRTKAFFKTIFLSKESLYRRYTYARNHHILLPIAFFNRLYDAIFKRGKSNLKSLKTMVSGTNKIIELKELLYELEL